MVCRIIVAGGTGFFGSAAVHRLRADGCDPLVASRRGPVALDVEDPASIRSVLREGDVVLDAVGPFQDRTTTLVEAAPEVGFDVVDISDSPAYCEKVLSRGADGVRLLTACSSISVVAASFIQSAGIAQPRSLSTFLAPETRFASQPGAATSLARSVGRPIRVLQGGRVVGRKGWTDARSFNAPPPVGPMDCRSFETADVVTLPPVWPSLRDVDFWVDTRIPFANTLFGWAGALGAARVLENRRVQALALPCARWLGRIGGAICVEIDENVRFAIVATLHGYDTPIVPAVIAARRLAEGRFTPKGVVPADRQVDPDAFFDYVRRLGMRVERLP